MHASRISTRSRTWLQVTKQRVVKPTGGVEEQDHDSSFQNLMREHE